MKHFAITDIWDEAIAFVRREYRLLLPVAFATMGLGGLIYSVAVPPASAVTGLPPAGPWTLVLLPVLLLVLTGNLAIATLVLRPGISVGEAIVAAVRRLPALLTIVLLMFALLLGVVFLAVLVGLVAALATGADQVQAATFAMALVVPLLLIVSIRLLPLWPVVADMPPRPAPATMLRRCGALTRGAFWRLLAMFLLYVLALFVVSSALGFGLGSVLLLIGKATGATKAMTLLLAVAMAAVDAALQAMWTVFVAVLYRRLSGASSGI